MTPTDRTQFFDEDFSSSNGWSVHFIDTDGRTRIGPWLLFDSAAEVEVVLRWGHITDEALADHRNCLAQWGVSSIGLHITAAERESLIQRAVGWPWNGYELGIMKAAGKYPPARQEVRGRRGV